MESSEGGTGVLYGSHTAGRGRGPKNQTRTQVFLKCAKKRGVLLFPIMTEREQCLKEILALLTKLSGQVGANNAVGFTDINKVSEDFACHLLNKVYNLNLSNLNAEQANYPGIDLGDDTNRISIQVTSDSSAKKVKDCVKKFEDHKHGERFDKLRILVLATKKGRLAKDPAPNKTFFAYKDDIVDFSNLFVTISGLTLEQIRDVHVFLKSELDDYTRRGSVSTVANEVETIARVIEYITSHKETPTTVWTEEPDPEGKISHRFSEHADFLKAEIIDLLPRYRDARMQVEKSLGLDTPAFEHLRTYLRSKSDDLLTQADNDARKALASLTEFLVDHISTAGKSYDHMAVRYFVLDELIRCNVFPK